MLVVSDTTPIISLLKLGKLHILKELFHEIIIPEAVHNELTSNPGYPEEADPTKVAEFEKRYDEIMQTAEREYTDNPPGKYYRDGYNLFMRMKEEKEKYLLFLHDMRVPATNNLAERCLRPYKRKQAQATVFRSFDSISYQCSGMSMLYLIRQKNDANVFEEVKKIFEK